jgi:hypothetical protein
MNLSDESFSSIYYSRIKWMEYLSNTFLPKKTFDEHGFSVHVDHLITNLESQNLINEDKKTIDQWYYFVHGDILGNYYRTDSPIYSEKKSLLAKRRSILIATIIRRYFTDEDINPTDTQLQGFKLDSFPFLQVNKTTKIVLDEPEWVYLYRYSKAVHYLKVLVTPARNKELYIMIGGLLEGSSRVYCRGGNVSSARKHREKIYQEILSVNNSNNSHSNSNSNRGNPVSLSTCSISSSPYPQLVASIPPTPSPPQRLARRIPLISELLESRHRIVTISKRKRENEDENDEEQEEEEEGDSDCIEGRDRKIPRKRRRNETEIENEAEQQVENGVFRAEEDNEDIEETDYNLISDNELSL